MTPNKWSKDLSRSLTDNFYCCLFCCTNSR